MVAPKRGSSVTPGGGLPRKPGGGTMRKKPFGYDFVMGIPPSFLAITLCIMGFIFWWQSRQLDEIVGREAHLQVRRVLDGDTFLANDENGYLLKVRLRAVDAPEVDQPHGRESAQYLQGMLQLPHTDVIAFFYERDFEGRYVADVFTQTSVSTEFKYVQEHLIRDGQAWHFGAFDRRMPLKEMMQNASAAKIGLWNSEEDPVAPWKWRRQQEREARESRRHGSSRRKGKERGGQRHGGKRDADPDARGRPGGGSGSRSSGQKRRRW
eukprot:TRINITY_DN66922_c0_g1_i1.p1 TRINITY_DN66922_c0_g1~~TRINITY_DN66922_c0_g1_i1.p1  ORF type:complete len:294 (+),score=118.94 TRINITY_DN66922_c0_g1_i1:86-883(+)